MVVPRRAHAEERCVGNTDHDDHNAHASTSVSTQVEHKERKRARGGAGETTRTEAERPTRHTALNTPQRKPRTDKSPKNQGRARARERERQRGVQCAEYHSEIKEKRVTAKGKNKRIRTTTTTGEGEEERGGARQTRHTSKQTHHHAFLARLVSARLLLVCRASFYISFCVLYAYIPIYLYMRMYMYFALHSDRGTTTPALSLSLPSTMSLLASSKPRVRGCTEA